MVSQLQKTFGQGVQDIREQQGLSQAALAQKLEMRQPDLCDLEKGRHSPTLETVERTSAVPGVLLQDLISTQVTCGCVSQSLTNVSSGMTQTPLPVTVSVASLEV
jgi:ribosome-binding protein aMBF1 (putative translation factor)